MIIWRALLDIATKPIEVEPRIRQAMEEISAICDACNWPQWFKAGMYFIVSIVIQQILKPSPAVELQNNPVVPSSFDIFLAQLPSTTTTTHSPSFDASSIQPSSAATTSLQSLLSDISLNQPSTSTITTIQSSSLSTLSTQPSASTTRVPSQEISPPPQTPPFSPKSGDKRKHVSSDHIQS